MAVSAFQKLMNKLLQQFFKANGRHPQTPKEYMDLQNEAVQFFNKTKGIPPGPAKPPFQGWKPKVIEGGHPSDLERASERTGKVFDSKTDTYVTPKGPEVSGIDSLLKSDFEKAVKKKDRPSIRLMKNFDQELDDITLAKEGYNLQEIGILQRARNIMKKEGQNPDDALAWVRSEMADAKGIEFEDFMTEFDWGDFPGKAEGGRIGLGAGGLAKGAKWFINSLKKNLTDMEAGHPRFKVVPAKDQETLKVGYRTFIKELEAGEAVPVEALEAISKNPQYFKTKKVTRSQDPDLAEVEELIDEKVFGNVRQELKDFEVVGRKPQQSGGLAYMLGEPTYMKAGGGRIGLKKGSESWRDKITRWAGGTSALAGELGLEGVHQMQSLLGLGGLYAGGGQVGHGPWTTGQVPQQQQPQQPQQQQQQQQQAPRHPQQGQPNPMKMPQGIPSAAPRSMDPRVMQQQAMQKAMMGQQQQRPRMADGGMTQEDFNQFLKERKEMHREGGKQGLQEDWEKYKRFKQYGQGAIQEAADGGRIGMMYGGDPGFAFEYGGSWADWHDSHRNQMPVEDYIQTKLPKDRLPFRDSAAGGGRIGFAGGGMGRRAFMKLMAGIASLPFIGKGLTKTVPKVIPKVTETIVARGADGMPTYVTDLITVVKAKGTRDIIEGFKKSDYGTVHRYKGVEVIDEAGGATRIKKGQEKSMYGSDEPSYHEIEMEISPQYREQYDPESGLSWYTNEKGRKVYETKIPDEYVEYTAKPDMDGKLKDVEEYIDDLDHLELKEIADEAKDLLKIKKASGGLAHMLGE